MGFGAWLASADGVAREHLGDLCTYRSGTGLAVDVHGIFDASYALVDPQQPGISSHTPAVFLRQAELPGDVVNDVAARVTHAGVEYSVREVKPDGLGGVFLLLHRVP